MKTNDFNFTSTNDKKSYTEHKKTLSSFNLQDLQNFPFFPKIKYIKTKFNNNQKKEESQLIRFDSLFGTCQGMMKMCGGMTVNGLHSAPQTIQRY